MEHPIPVESLSPQVIKVCGPQAPPQLKDMAAGGLAPLGPVDLVTALYVLSYDPDKGIKDKAGASLLGLPDGMLNGALEQVADEYVVDGLCRLLIKRPLSIEKILLNSVTNDETAKWIATSSDNERVLETVAANEERLLRCPQIIEALYTNKTTRMSTVDRAVELAVRNDIELKGIACFNEVKASIKGELIPEATEERTPDDSMFQDNLEGDEWKELDEDQINEAYETIEKGEEEKTETVKKVETLEQSLARLTISAKIRVATLGSAGQRSILIRDANKLVSMAVVKSPGIRESEIMQYCTFRSLPQEAVRYMASNREWTKHYIVKLNLVQNPKCPLDISLRFLQHLRMNDVSVLMRSKNVPAAISKAAKQLRNKRMG